MKRTTTVATMVKILSILIIGVAAAFSWFVNYESTETIGGDITIDVDEYKNISVNVSDIYVGDFTFKNECVSGNGLTFYGIDTDQSGRTITGYHQIEIGSDEYNHSVFEAQIAFTSYQKLVLYLGERCSVTPVIKDTNGNPIYDSPDDYIGGAIRVAFLPTEHINDEFVVSETERVIWVPNTTYEYNKTTLAANTNGAVETSIKYLTNALGATGEVLTSGSAQGFDMDAKMIWGTPIADVHRNLSLFTIDNNLETITYVTIRIWVEGTDREAQKELMGGSFNMHLHFIILDGDDNET